MGYIHINLTEENERKLRKRYYRRWGDLSKTVNQALENYHNQKQ